MRQKSIKNALIILLFFLALFIPFFVGLFEQGVIISNTEKRKLAKFPKIPENLKEFTQMPATIEDYFSDHFGFRDAFNRYYRASKAYLGDSPSSDVTLGKDRWLFLGSISNNYNNFGDPIGDFRNKNVYSDKKLAQITQYLSGQHRWLKQQGIEYLFFIAPNKHSIHSDKLPSYLAGKSAKVNSESATDQLINHLRQSTDINVLDLRPRLIENNTQQLYYKGDTHWNHIAANIAQHQIMQNIAQLFPNKIKAELFKTKPSNNAFNGDLARFIGAKKYDLFNPIPVFDDHCKPKQVSRNKQGTQITSSCNTQQLKTIIYGDSFFKNFLLKYFSVKFKETTFLWRKPHYQSLKQQIKLHRPDIVIEEWVERHLPYVPKHYDIFERL